MSHPGCVHDTTRSSAASRLLPVKRAAGSADVDDDVVGVDHGSTNPSDDQCRECHIGMDRCRIHRTPPPEKISDTGGGVARGGVVGVICVGVVVGRVRNPDHVGRIDHTVVVEQPTECPVVDHDVHERLRRASVSGTGRPTDENRMQCVELPARNVSPEENELRR